MGTRGAVGFRYKDTDYVSYNHYDSYPSGLGVDTVNNVKALIGMYGIDGLRERVQNLRLVNPNDTPMLNDLMQYDSLHQNVSTGSDWYSLLRGIQGDLYAYIEHGIMTDDAVFLKDSLFCEWAYIVNLDTLMLEVYRGFQTKEHKRGRYAAPKDANWSPAYEGQNYYYPVKLIAEFSLSDIPNNFVNLVSPGRVVRKGAGTKRKVASV